MIATTEDGRSLEVRVRHEVLRVEPWGDGSLRVRAGRHRILDDVPGALLPAKPSSATATADGRTGRVVNGALTAIVELADTDTGIDAQLRFVRTDTGEELLSEQRAHFWWPGARLFMPSRNGYGRLEQRFAAYDDERVYGLGQHTHGRLDQKGLVLDLVQRNAEVSVPFLLSSRGYGFLWNSPAVGRVELAANGTRWVADDARQLDYWITTGDGPRQVLSHYADATGHAPMLPEWAAGFWQSKLRYRTQDELLAVAREYHARGLPLSVIVADFFHWTHLGDWRFDPDGWPDPAGMIRELADLGVKLMVSVWPSVSPLSENYRELHEQGLLVAAESGVPAHAPWKDKGFDVEMPVAFYDATNPAARRFVWAKVKENYYDLGVRAWWLDGDEPEIQPGHPHNLGFHAGPGSEVFNLYPQANAQAFHDGIRAEGDDEVVLLSRSAWAGSQRYGAALWSGDVAATWESLRAQVRAGLNVALAGIPWWTTDIGGFHGGDPASPEYRELMVRWFSYGVCCPLFRLHGFRDPRPPFGPAMTGGPNEVWSYGDSAYEAITASLRLRERLRPYLMAQMRVAHEQGIPPMRPLFVDFPGDPESWTVEDAFLLGPDLLVAPVLEPGATARAVYLPDGAVWTDAVTGKRYDGGTSVEAPAPADRIPLFLRDDVVLPIRPE
ncbi:family 31 glucosidase [Amycolatopsis sp. FBCC-B4732]|uniref:glycoside hydrolase family 31 protein n=1 Tax=Amycolatopsis sp. FBCC-B4732 TaxID=3079339 RepID=UPI001FF6D8E3|nr:TIM-barrel domain-containing protein [Amycolatopsis sp. FBCC-B4732]UOX91987.1 family 31 glucosidase [Amycolatopsis sp. FBCC-B4732]